MVIAGILVGLLGGPLILYLLGTLVIRMRLDNFQKQMRVMREEHNREIRRIQKEYSGLRKQFNKKTVKMQKIVAKVKEEKADAQYD